MSTYRELVYLILDELKNISDDAHFQPEHVLFLLDKYRALLLRQNYKDIKKEIPDSNYQTICLDLEPSSGGICQGRYLKSKQQVPSMMKISRQTVSGSDYFGSNIAYVSNGRFRYAGTGCHGKNMIFSTIAPDGHLYLKSGNPQAYYMEGAKVTGIFEDARKAAELECNAEGNRCDVMDADFPLEEGLIPQAVQLIMQELTGTKFQPEDDENNANDDLSTLASYIRQQIAAGRYSPLLRNINGREDNRQ